MSTRPLANARGTRECLEVGARGAQLRTRDGHASQRVEDRVGDNGPRGPWLNTIDAAAHLRFTGKHPIRSVYKFMKRHGIVGIHDGRRLLIAKADVERALNRARFSAAPHRKVG